MQHRKYLLSVREFLEGEKRVRLLKEALGKVDEERCRKAERMRTDQGKAACLGAGLLLQLAVQEAVGSSDSTGILRRDSKAGGMEPIVNRGYGMVPYSVSHLMELLSVSVSLSYHYGKNGKPYFDHLPFYFNLSHSGEYVFCVLASHEVGADIQQYGTGSCERLAERFFAPEEVAALKDCKEGKELLFYRLWTRKEAYGKLTGEGLLGSMSTCFLPGREQTPKERELVWEEYDGLAEYHMTVCRYASEPGMESADKECGGF